MNHTVIDSAELAELRAVKDELLVALKRCNDFLAGTGAEDFHRRELVIAIERASK